MPFTSFAFILFLAIVVTVYYVTPKRWQWVILLVASYVFYLFAGARFVPYLVFTTLTTYGAAIRLDRINKQYNAQLQSPAHELPREDRKVLKIAAERRKKRVLTLVLLLNFGLLAFVKYFNFIGDNINALLADLGAGAAAPQLGLLLPLGISFYTFQSMGYIIDVYRGKYEPERNPAKLALFISFFPQMVQGPIGRYDALAPQLAAPHSFDYERAKQGIQLIIWGYFKKLVIADRAAIFVDQVITYYTAYTGLYIPIAIILYAVQIYTDFSGGIDIATGAAQILGIDLAANFRRPYFAQTIAEYWRRWHITLGAWMRDYLYYPLALSKGLARIGKWLRKKVNNRFGVLFPALMAEAVVFLVIGIWHGPAWKYIAYGIYYGLLIVLGMLLQPLSEKATAALHIKTDCFSWRLWRVLRTFALTCFGRYLTRAPNLGDSYQMMKLTVTEFNPGILLDGSLYTLGLDAKNIRLLFAAILVLLVVSILQEKGYHIREKLQEQNLVFQWAIMLAGIFAVLIFGTYGSGYDATKFIYELF
ncbi:MAG: MBOAT family protein [Chloroflexi bacterium]|nr:MBOAT family protein [Chloroflexota bacterium]